MQLRPAQQRHIGSQASRPSRQPVREPQVEGGPPALGVPVDQADPQPDAAPGTALTDTFAATSDALAAPAPGEVSDELAHQLREQEHTRRAFDSLPAGQTPTEFARAVINTVHSARNLSFLLDVQPLKERLNAMQGANGDFPFRDVSGILLVQLNSAFSKIDFTEGRRLIADQLRELGAGGQLPKSCEAQPAKAAVFARELKSDIAWTAAAYDKYYHRK